jgi:hypothetical protein
MHILCAEQSPIARNAVARVLLVLSPPSLPQYYDVPALVTWRLVAEILCPVEVLRSLPFL